MRSAHNTDRMIRVLQEREVSASYPCASFRVTRAVPRARHSALSRCAPRGGAEPNIRLRLSVRERLPVLLHTLTTRVSVNEQDSTLIQLGAQHLGPAVPWE